MRTGIGIGPQYPSRALSGYVYVLDEYPGATVGLSFRLLKSDYAGNCIRIRRSSDNTEQDIGFSGTYVNRSAITSFVGASNGFIVKWYDQTGNGNDFTQTTASAQPKIISSSTFDGRNGFIGGRYDGVTIVLQRATVVTNYAFSTFAVADSSGANGFAAVSGSYNADNFKWWASVWNRSSTYANTLISTNTTQTSADAGSYVADTIFQGTSIHKSATSGVVYNNNNTSNTNNSLSGTYFPLSTTDLGLIYRAANPVNWGNVGYLYETIIYTSDKTADQSAIAVLQKRYYNT